MGDKLLGGSALPGGDNPTLLPLPPPDVVFHLDRKLFVLAQKDARPPGENPKDDDSREQCASFTHSVSASWKGMYPAERTQMRQRVR